MRKLGEICTLGQYADARVWIPVKAKAHTIFEGVLTPPQIRAFAKGPLLISGISYHLNRRSKPPLPDGPVLAIYCDESDWSSIVRDNTATDIIYVPWMEEQLKTYLMGYQDSELVVEGGQARADVPPPTSPEALAEVVARLSSNQLGAGGSPANLVLDPMNHENHNQAPESPEAQSSEPPIPPGKLSFKKLTRANREWRVGLCAAYERTATGVDFSAKPEDFEQFASALVSFPPSTPEHEISLSAGSDFGPWDHYVILSAKTFATGGHYLWVYTNNRQDDGESAVVTYVMRCDAASFQRLGALILAWLKDPQLPLEWTAHPGCPQPKRESVPAQNPLHKKYGLC